MRLTLAQLNPTVGDVAGNRHLLMRAAERARAEGSDLLVGGELGLLGYPPRDLLFRKGVVEACEQAVEEIAREAGDLAIVAGHPRRSGAGTSPFLNSASVCAGGRVVAVGDKRLLPGYDVFDEDRYFERGDRPCVFDVAGRRLGLLICEDFWRAEDTTTGRAYALDPVREAMALGCDGLVVVNACPFVLGKWQRQLARLRAAARAHGVPIAAVHQVGGNDDLVFSGRSVVLDGTGRVLAALPPWTEAVQTVELPAPGVTVAGAEPEDALDEPRETFGALVLGIRDYVRKTGHREVLVGLSGGIDSAVTAALAAAAVGPDNVIAVMMPSRHSQSASLDDALALADNLRVERRETVAIEPAHVALRDMLARPLGEGVEGITDENLQARIRGLVLMAFANATGALVLVPSNKSEMATGYSTLYGDMVGALAVLGDVVKTRVYALARWINAHPDAAGLERPPIPEWSLARPPSAELRPDQIDQDTLPPYEVLDQVVERYVEREQSIRQIVEETALEPHLVRETAAMIDRAQYKRDQAPPVLKVTPRTFGRGRPMPIAMKWREAVREAPAAVHESST